MTSTVSVHGPPGAGKTQALSGLATNAIHRHGPFKVGAMTYTKTAALELKARLALSLGITNYKIAEHTLPFVGTIHSLCWRALGRPPILKPEHFREFCQDVGLPVPRTLRDHPSNPDDINPLWYAELDGTGEQADFFRKMLATVRHSGRPFHEVIGDVPPNRRVMLSPSRMQELALQYEMWKHDHSLIDFEDILEQGARRPPPVDVLFCDEVQDNSLLMWSVIDKWAQLQLQSLVLVGDPFQSLYRYVGADPSLFMNHPTDEWVYLTTSHRLPPGADAYAQRVLTSGGWNGDDDMRFHNWTSAGGRAHDGSKFIIARTRAGLTDIKESLRLAGTPYGELRGRGPLETRAAGAYRILTDLLAGEPASLGQLQAVAAGVDVKLLSPDQRARIALLKKAHSVPEQDRTGAEWWLGGDLDHLRNLLSNAPYFRIIEQRDGRAGLSLIPKLKVGTIHASKGREADEVEVATSWGYIPANAIYASQQGKRSEALVAYVGASRHRTDLSFRFVATGRSYPWPSK